MLKKAVVQDPIHEFAWYVSIVLNPTTLGVVAVTAFSLLFGAGGSETVKLFSISFLFCVLLPFLYIVYLKRTNSVDSLDVPVRTQRTVPYLIASVSYLIGLLWLIGLDAPWPIIALLVCYLGNTVFVVIVNLFWKISAHAMGVGAVITGFGIAVSPMYFIGLILLPIVSWSRIKLDMHSTWQVIAGSIFSVILTAVQFEIVYRLYH